MTPQHPAAPETEAGVKTCADPEPHAGHNWPGFPPDVWHCQGVRLGLTDDERALLAEAFGGASPSSLLTSRVERIVAERVRVVEGERDAVVEVGAYAQQKEATARAVNDAARMAQVAARRSRELAAMTARAESAEAAHEAEKAAHKRLRRRLRALAKELAVRAERQHAIGDEPGRSSADRHRFNGEGTGLGIAHMLVAELLAGGEG